MAVPKRPLTVVRRAAVASAVQGGSAAGSPPQAKQSAAGLDAIDLTIIRILQNDGRAAFTAIAKQLGISEGAVRNRVVNLEAIGAEFAEQPKAPQ